MERPRLRTIAAWAGLLVVAFAPAATAQELVPSERVTSRVILREGPTTRSADVGSLRPGERATLLAAGEGWHRVRLPDGAEGYVSAAWTVVVPAAWDVAARPPPGVDEAQAERFDFRPEATLAARWRGGDPDRPRGLFQRMARFFSRPTQVTLELESPAVGDRVRRHYDPRLPVAGLAHSSGNAGNFDVMLVIDVSASTNEFAEADVDGDGRAEDDWNSADSILRAQALAAAEFVRRVRRLPGNRDGRRIRVGVVTFSGDDARLLDPADRELELGEADLRALARRDARLLVPLTRDYDAALDGLATLARTPGSGMTDFAAGITRAAVELAGLEGAESERREDAERVVYFLTDGKPRLPYDREKAARAARKAAALADRHRVRIHSFALGRDAVTGKLGRTVQRIARDTGGVCVELEDPADIVPLLRASALSFVDRVKIANRTTGEETDYVTTGIDGSFYGEIPLVEGENEIELVAVLYGGQEHRRTLQVRFDPVPREQRMAEELDEIRRENAALIEEIKERMRAKLAREMDAARAAAAPPDQARELEVRVEAGAREP